MFPYEFSMDYPFNKKIVLLSENIYLSEMGIANFVSSPLIANLLIYFGVCSMLIR
jgi:hypothetical protein